MLSYTKGGGTHEEILNFSTKQISTLAQRKSLEFELSNKTIQESNNARNFTFE